VAGSGDERRDAECVECGTMRTFVRSPRRKVTLLHAILLGFVWARWLDTKRHDRNRRFRCTECGVAADLPEELPLDVHDVPPPTRFGS
jgi:hypothetical protein